GGCCLDYSVVTLFNSIPRDASHASVAALWSNCRGTLPSHPHAAGSRRSNHLGTGAPRAVFRRRSSPALFDLYHPHRDRFYSDCHSPRSETVPAATDHRLYTS